MDELTAVPVTEQNPAALLALMWFAATEGQGRKSMVVLPYKDRLSFFSRYLQQLIMESLGKERDCAGAAVLQGLTVFGNKGSTDQHAYVQQLRDGLNNFFVTFIQVLEDYCGALRPLTDVTVADGVRSGDYLNGFLLGTRSALFENGRDSLTLSLDRLDAKTLGAVIALYERAVGFYASLIQVNAYHQPGVEAGKKAAERVVTTQQRVLCFLAQHRGQEFTVPALAAACHLAGDEETVFQVLEHLAANAHLLPGHSAPKLVRRGGRLPHEARYELL
jgi:glucose-6-phosphate isomerase